MEKYNHYSFDLWLTLIKSNPEFKEQRDLLFHETYNPQGLPLEEVSAIIRKIDIDSNKCSEITELHVPCERMIYDILQGMKHNNITFDLIHRIKGQIQAYFILLPPSLYDEYTKSTLELLYRQGYILNIASNTGFILGDTLDMVLEQLGIRKYFKFALYSDELGTSKPNNMFFIQILEQSFRGSKIIHVGDNPIADGGSVNAGIVYFQINSNEKTIKDLL